MRTLSRQRQPDYGEDASPGLERGKTGRRKTSQVEGKEAVEEFRKEVSK